MNHLAPQVKILYDMIAIKKDLQQLITKKEDEKLCRENRNAES
jgi:hypothetical protein